MDPVSRCSNDINACHREDQYSREKLDEVVAQRGGKPASKSLTPSGIGYAAAKHESSATEAGKRMARKAAGPVAEAAGSEVAKHVAEKRTHKALVTFAKRTASPALGKVAGGAAKVVAGAGFLATVYEGVKLATEAHAGAVADAREQGQREMDGLNRDAMRAFIFAGTGDVLPAAYRAHIAAGVSEQGKRVAMKMVTHASVEANGRYEAEKHVMRTMAREGMAAAKRLLVSSRESLESALKADASFREKFESSTAFRLGVGAVLFQHGVR